MARYAITTNLDHGAILAEADKTSPGHRLHILAGALVADNRASQDLAHSIIERLEREAAGIKPATWVKCGDEWLAKGVGLKVGDQIGIESRDGRVTEGWVATIISDDEDGTIVVHKPYPVEAKLAEPAGEALPEIAPAAEWKHRRSGVVVAQDDEVKVVVKTSRGATTAILTADIPGSVRGLSSASVHDWGELDARFGRDQWQRLLAVAVSAYEQEGR